jgi:FAD/FMN-containing dehydrogenase
MSGSNQAQETNFNRRDFLKAAASLALIPSIPVPAASQQTLVNDVESQLNLTRVDRIASVRSRDELCSAVRTARGSGKSISIAGGRHAMGGQQFGTDTLLVDTRQLNRVLSFDAGKGLIEVEVGIEWPQLIEHYLALQQDAPRPWGIAQKQTGGDRLSMGGALAANAHGRGLRMKPIISDVESFVLVDARGELRTCSRRENSELFGLVIGGYGLFGMVYSVVLRLAPRRKVERIVEILQADDLMPRFEQRIADGFLYGDFQFSIDEKSDDFMRRGVFSCYRPVDPATPVAAAQKELGEKDWRDLLYLAHADKAEAFRQYAGYYLSTTGQIYWSDTHQLSIFPDDYHRELDQKLGAQHPATEIITEINVPRQALAAFLSEAREDFRKHRVEVIYGTIRLIERDEESFLPWAKQPYACIIFNLHTVHTPEGLKHSADAFRRLIDMANRLGGSYYLTYHKYATREQIESCYPQFPEFLRLKKKYDPEERFQSDWYRHHRKMFRDVLA